MPACCLSVSRADFMTVCVRARSGWLMAGMRMHQAGEWKVGPSCYPILDPCASCCMHPDVHFLPWRHPCCNLQSGGARVAGGRLVAEQGYRVSDPGWDLLPYARLWWTLSTAQAKVRSISCLACLPCSHTDTLPWIACATTNCVPAKLPLTAMCLPYRYPWKMWNLRHSSWGRGLRRAKCTSSFQRLYQPK